ncbi:hypothetical protein BpHYR1_020805 [Brachionus plicatilis]|uniref:Uncharacterized protein n=1 Tax=Brachionus plicatilis TaxID=10195 RepID=A0A3M7PV84_BRAPC|nr:hypothetical protein BpHYR1_020805 [Brachionus plicatilis]
MPQSREFADWSRGRIDALAAKRRFIIFLCLIRDELDLAGNFLVSEEEEECKFSGRLNFRSFLSIRFEFDFFLSLLDKFLRIIAWQFIYMLKFENQLFFANFFIGFDKFSIKEHNKMIKIK